MRRLARRLFTALAILSLLLCAAACVLWVWSYARGDTWWWEDDATGRYRYVSTSRGRVLFSRVEPVTPADPSDGERDVAPTWHHRTSRTPGVLITCEHQTGWPLPGFAMRGGAEARTDQVIVAHAHVALVSALVPVAWAGRRLRASQARRRSRRGRCPACGYDVRATPGRCPECGT